MTAGHIHGPGYSETGLAYDPAFPRKHTAEYRQKLAQGTPHETPAERAARRTMGLEPDKTADILDIWRLERRLTRHTVLISIVALVASADLALNLLARGGWM